MIGCFGESRLALTAAAHLAMARPNICFIDLDSAFNFITDPVIGGMNYDKKVNVSLSAMELKVLKQFLNDNVSSSDLNQISLSKIKNKLNKGE